MNRRSALKLGTLGALAATTGWGAWRVWPPRPSATLLPVDELARRFALSLSDAQRSSTCVPYDHPLRQYHNRGVWGGGAPVFTDFGRAQRALVTDLLYAGLSPAGRARIPREFFLDLPGAHLLRVLVCGDPLDPPYQIVLSGPHLNLRLGGASREGVAFGGPQVYGDQRGDGRAGLPGNLYRSQFLRAVELFRGLSPTQRAEARLESAPIQTRIELQGRAGRFPGTALAEAGPETLDQARALVAEILGLYREEDASYAHECLAANGGVEGLFFSTYAEGELGGEGLAQIFRLEGPAAVLYFRGAPHVHAFVNVGMDGEAPLSVGEVLGTNPRELDGPGVKRLFERALRDATGADLAWYDLEAAVGRLRAGTVRTGDVFVLESWQDRISVVSVRGARLAPALAAALVAAGTPPEPQRLYDIATVADAQEAVALGRPESRRGTELLLRDATVAFLRTHGFADLHEG